MARRVEKLIRSLTDRIRNSMIRVPRSLPRRTRKMSSVPLGVFRNID